MIQKPQFKAHFHVEIVKDEGIFLVSEIGHSVMNGRLFELVAPLIDGRRSTDDIVEELQAQASAAEVYYALTLLEQKGYLCESEQSSSTANRPSGPSRISLHRQRRAVWRKPKCLSPLLATYRSNPSWRSSRRFTCAWAKRESWASC